MILYRAHTLTPVSRPPVSDGGVLVDDGRIVEAGEWKALHRDHAAAAVRDLGRVVVIPGLVNAHTHLELAWIAADTLPAGDYLGWVRALLARRAVVDAELAREKAAEALVAMRGRGTVAIADVGNEGWSAREIAAADVAGVYFLEVYGFRGADADGIMADGERRLAALAGEPAIEAAGARLRLALTAHAPHTTSAHLLRSVAARAASGKSPLSIHTAESREELELLDDGGGPLPDFYRERDFWDDGFAPPRQTPVEHLDRLGALGEGTLVVHAVHLERHDRAKLQARRCTVVGCPRSNERLGVGTAPLAELLAEGIPVALGTDSTASSPDLDMFGEMAAVRRLHPSLSPMAILRMATLNGARALGLGDELGTIEAGKRDALAVVAIPEESEPLESLCAVPAAVFPIAEAPFEGPA